jgi:glutamate 5-kinase
MPDAISGRKVPPYDWHGTRKLQHRRVVVKAGTSVLTAGTDNLDHDFLVELVGQIKSLREAGADVLLVTSGAIAAGLEVLASNSRGKDVPFRQVLAAIGQGRLMHVYDQLFASQGIRVAQALLTWNDLSDRDRYLNVRNTLISLLELGVVPVLNENDVVAVDEIGENFGDNDRLSALIANLVDADLLVILTDIDGLYTADPRENPAATLVPVVDRVDSSIEAMAGSLLHPWARGGMPAKLEAAKLATTSGIYMVICHGRVKDVLLKVARGEDVGTLFLPVADRVESRKRWLLSGLNSSGAILIDNGAAVALGSENRSLLPAGVTGVKGEFQRGEVVHIVCFDGGEVACGIANYSSKEIDQIKGCRSDCILDILGYQYGQEVIHRNNMALL